MIRDIEIQNFRCFEQTKIEGFDRVNLIGGKNNSGKTALLEALIVADNPENILYLKNLRKESIEISHFLPSQGLEDLFFRNLHHKQINLYLHQEEQRVKFTRITYNKNVREQLQSAYDAKSTLWQSIVSYDQYSTPYLEIYDVEYFQYTSDEDFLKLIKSTQDKDGSGKLIISTPREYIIANRIKGIMNVIGLDINGLKTLPVIPAFVTRSNSDLTQDYERLVFQDRDREVLEALQVLDPSIEKIESFSIGSPRLYLTKKNERRLPISLFGDAINRITQIILKLLKRDSSILLIDEIENGIHYTNQREFWKILFRLAIELDTQIFATTHSLEMIRAFADVGLEYYPDRGAYFELTKSQRTDKIIGVKWELELLEYTLNNQGRVRGETLEDVRKSTNEHKES